MREKLREISQDLPRVPGVYIYKNLLGAVIYVGKAKNLRSRVSSYFHTKIQDGTKTHALVQKINDIEYIEAVSELEALILEAELIKKFKPRYNIIYKDDKSYLYIVIRGEWLKVAGKRKKLPTVLTARKTDLKPKDIKFGPYPDGSTAKYIVKTVRKIFPFRDCSVAKFSRYQKLERVCLFGDLGLCGGPCVNNNKKALAVYKRNIKNIQNLLSGQSSKIIKDLARKMKEQSKTQKYEEAAKYRDLITKFEYIRQNFRSPDEYINNPYLVEDLLKDSIEKLAEVLPHVDKPPKRIECYDISNISGKEAVGSMVVAINGRIDKKEYRKFKVKFKTTPDDSGMVEEVLVRRLKREVSKNKNIKKWDTPDLVVVDGGKGQVSAALKATWEVHLPHICSILAKKQETLVYKQKRGFVEKNVAKSNAGLNLLIRLRDESHRFAQSYHHLLRLKKIKES